MSDLVSNVLDLMRFESGQVRLRRDWQPLEDLVGAGARNGCGSGCANTLSRSACRPTCRRSTWMRGSSCSSSATCSTTSPSTRRPVPASWISRDPGTAIPCGSSWRTRVPASRPASRPSCSRNSNAATRRAPWSVRGWGSPSAAPSCARMAARSKRGGARAAEHRFEFTLPTKGARRVTEAMHQVLVIEDEPAIRNVLKVLLEAERYRVIEADTAVRAEIEARSHKPDLLLVDLGLPDSDGLTVIRRRARLVARPDRRALGAHHGGPEDRRARCRRRRLCHQAFQRAGAARAGPRGAAAQRAQRRADLRPEARRRAARSGQTRGPRLRRESST